MLRGREILNDHVDFGVVDELARPLGVGLVEALLLSGVSEANLRQIAAGLRIQRARMQPLPRIGAASSATNAQRYYSHDEETRGAHDDLPFAEKRGDKARFTR